MSESLRLQVYLSLFAGPQQPQVFFEGHSLAVVCMKKEGESKTGEGGLMSSPLWKVQVSR